MKCESAGICEKYSRVEKNYKNLWIWKKVNRESGFGKMGENRLFFTQRAKCVRYLSEIAYRTA